jgi:multidrug efflux system membrane fusion protein
MNRRLILAAAMAFSGLPAASVWAADDTAGVKSVAAKASAAGTQELSLDAVVEAVRQATLSSQVAGAIVVLNVKAGDQVKAGDVLMVIEAMKMETNIKAKEDGSIAEVKFKEGDKIEKEDLVVVFA